MKLKLKNVRLAFPALFEARAFGDADPRFSGVFIIDPESDNVQAIRDVILGAAIEKWNEHGKPILAKLQKEGRLCFSTDEKTNGAGEVYDGFEGNYSLSASAKVRPLILDRDRSQLAEDDGRPYGGAFVNCVLDVWAQDNQFGKRVNASLKGVQFVRDGEAFAGGTPAAVSDFDELEPDEGLGMGVDPGPDDQDDLWG